VDESLYQKIVRDVKTFWKDEENRASALKVVSANIHSVFYTRRRCGENWGSDLVSID